MTRVSASMSATSCLSPRRFEVPVSATEAVRKVWETPMTPLDMAIKTSRCEKRDENLGPLNE